MKWHEIILTKEATQTDELGNEVATGEPVEIDRGLGRLVPVGREYKAIDGRTLTDGESQFSITIPYDTAKQATAATVDGTSYEVVAVSDLEPRWAVLTVRGWRV